MLRLGAAVVVVVAALLMLRQSGVIFQDQAENTGSGVTVEPADASLTTPNPGGLNVGLREGELAPDFAFSSFEGERLKLSDYRGRAVLLNFWATWCGPCRVELPDMETMLQRYQDQELAVIAVNNGESLAAGQRFLDPLEVRLTAFAYDPRQTIVKRYSLVGMPTSYFINAEGVIVRVVAGQLSIGLMESVLAEALAAPGAAGN
jgi:thiol-disulfide isomerase/thioredoxin